MTINAIAGAKNVSNQSNMRNPKKNISSTGSTNALGLKSTTGEAKRRRSDGQNVATRPNPKIAQD